MNNMRVDLNFVFIVEALVEEGSVSAAAERLGMSQPALSHALARLRRRFDDPLFVKTRAGMRPTPTAERIAGASKKVLALVREEVLDGRTFDPAVSTRTFTLGLSDMTATVILGEVTERFARAAPLAKLLTVNVRRDDVAARLEEGLIDVVVGAYEVDAPSLMQQALFKATAHVCIVREGHPHIREQLSLQQFVDTPHVMASQSADANAYVDRTLRSKGLSRRVAVEVPYLLPLPHVVAHSDYIALVPGALAVLSQKFTPLRILKSPIQPPVPVIRQYWHRRFKADKPLTWFRSLLAEPWKL